MMSLSDDKQADFIDAFNITSRYLDDILNINNVYFDNMVSQIYPSEPFIAAKSLFVRPNGTLDYVPFELISKCFHLQLSSIFIFVTNKVMNVT